MAYSFTDPYRPLRIALRAEGLLIGFGLGLMLILLPERLLALGGVPVLDGGWPYHLAGAALVGLGLFFLLAAGEPAIGNTILLPTMVSNLLFVLVLLIAYLQGELSGLTLAGQILLLLVFIVCLVTGILPLRYFHAEFQM